MHALQPLQFLRAEGAEWDEETSEAAAKGGHLELLQWARAQTPPTTWDKRTGNGAAGCGQFAALKWARAQTPQAPLDLLLSLGAARNGHLEVLEWACAQSPPAEWDEGTCQYAAMGGHIEVLKSPDTTSGTAGRSNCAARFNPFRIWAERPTAMATNSPA